MSHEYKSYISVALIAGICSGVAVVLLLVVAVLAFRQYQHHQDKLAQAPGPRRPPKFGPSFDYCEGYYGDDRPGRRQLNNIEGDYSDYIEEEEDDDDGQDEEGNRDYVYDDNGYVVPA